MRSRRRPTTALILLVLLGVSVTGCVSTESELSAAQVFARMEQRLLGVDSLEFEVASTGAFEASFEGWFRRDGGDLAIAAQGTWGGEPVSVSAETTRNMLVINTPKQIERVRREPFVATAVLVGLTRMGVLHNLARLVAGKAPDHADGGVRDWVAAENIEFVGDDRSAIRFDILVDGTKAGVALVRVDPVSGLPLDREQTVEFAEGSMRVVETYRY